MDSFSDDVRRNPYPLYARMRQQAPVVRVPAAHGWMVFDYENVRRVLTDHEHFSSSVVPPTGAAPPWLVFLDPPRHTRLRALIVRAFTPRAIGALEPRIRALSDQLLQPALRHGELDLVDDYAIPLPTLVIAEMMGIPLSDRPRFTRRSEAIVNLSYSVSGGVDAAGAIAAHAVARAEMEGYVRAALASRRDVPTDDLLSRLLYAEVDGERLAETEILGFFQLLLSAATETTTNLIDNGMLSLMAHPAQMERLRSASPALMQTAVEEIIRYRSPGQMMFRQTTRDVELSGETIPAGQMILAMIGSANHDPKIFEQPENFDVARDPNPHIGFGHGIHFCLGAALARLEARIAFEHLLERFQRIELASDAPWVPRRALHVHGPVHLPLNVAPHMRV